VSFAWTITSMVVAPRDALSSAGATGAGGCAAGAGAGSVCATGWKTGGT